MYFKFSRHHLFTKSCRCPPHKTAMDRINRRQPTNKYHHKYLFSPSIHRTHERALMKTSRDAPRRNKPRHHDIMTCTRRAPIAKRIRITEWFTDRCCAALETLWMPYSSKHLPTHFASNIHRSCARLPWSWQPCCRPIRDMFPDK